jgi:carbonyl reductase 1
VLLIVCRWWSAETVAVVTGGNKGIGFETVRQLATKGLTVVLTARDAKLGRAAVDSLHAQGLTAVVFHALDIGSPESVREFAKWIKSTYGGLDILVIIFNFLFPNERTVDKDLRLVQI